MNASHTEPGTTIHFALAAQGARMARRRIERSLALGLPLALAIGLLYAAMIVADGIVADAVASTAALPHVVVQDLSWGVLRPVSVARVTNAVAGLPEVTKVSPRWWALVPAPGEAGALAVVAALGEEGPQGAAAPARGQVWLGSGLARLGNLSAGKRWSPTGAGARLELEVLGTLSESTAVFTANLAVAHPHDVAALAGIGPGEATEVGLHLTDPGLARQTAEVLARALPELRLVERSATARLIEVVYGDRLGRWAALWLVLLAAPLGLALALGFDIAASERRELGILKALGWSSLMLIEVKVAEALLIATCATAVGMGWGLAYAGAGAPGLASFFVGWAELYPDFPVPLALRGSSALAVAAVGIVPMMAAAALPAWRVGTEAPDAAMRE